MRTNSLVLAVSVLVAYTYVRDYNAATAAAITAAASSAAAQEAAQHDAAAPTVMPEAADAEFAPEVDDLEVLSSSYAGAPTLKVLYCSS